ncbi:MAG: glycerophosphodiester phosphodiesterase [Anaerolineae bacterium]|jgi:glycerophosphoryl diester phosphodiesterase|nr:glycerophosphodiester phosphodiesterase [Anaerolineae bacterium]MBT7071629.1 glycerophosphodiester phosphodiesterase [Anaerolineae bacterium]MBT7324246.1 glycerophosphodiester phosphodiesterase [Anaerolineae bacterium]
MKKVLGVFILLVVTVLVGLRLGSRPAPEHPFFAQFKQYPLVIAHQGGDNVWPGETLYAYEQAAALDVDILEMDAHITADGVLILMHDETVDRTTNGSGLIEEMTLDELKELDAAYRWSIDEGATYPYRGQGITITALEEVFQTFPGYPVNIEIKKTERSMAQPLCDLLREYEMQDKALIASFHDERMAEFREVCPEVATSGSKGEVTKFVILNYAFLGGLYSPAEHALQVPERNSGILVVRPGLMWGAHRRNLQVHIWTPNTTEELEHFINMGVDGIITDRPDLLVELLGR